MAEDKSRYIEMLHNALLEGYALLTIIKNSDGTHHDYEVVETNSQFEKITRLSDGYAIGKTIRQVLPAIDENWSKFSRNIPVCPGSVKFEFYFENIDKHFLISAFMPEEDRIVLLFSEITLQKKAKDAFRIHEVLFEEAHDIMLYIKMDGRIVNANKRACDKYGYTREQLLSMNVQDIRHPFTAFEFEKQMEQADREGIVFESVHMRSDGTSFPVEVSAKSTFTERGQFRIHIIRDITQRKETEEKIAWLAQYDALTGIPNRAKFISNLEEEIQRSKRSGMRFAVMLFDIDKFKYINDHHGHDAGDSVLRNVAVSAKQVLRSTDRIGRLGGDEFVVLQTGIKDCADVASLAKRIQTAVHETFTYKSMQFNMKISIGISIFPDDSKDANGLLYYADKAMYEDKHSGGGNFGFFVSCRTPCVEERLCLDKDSVMHV